MFGEFKKRRDFVTLTGVRHHQERLLSVGYECRVKSRYRLRNAWKGGIGKNNPVRVIDISLSTNLFWRNLGSAGSIPRPLAL